ncbi:MAG TPA: helix-turn-helix domain-containing protein [Thermoleophilaceae bacterium]|jgi:DNA-binding transcriptional ArsR family regulator|nr:helix-turn-helix domain-containing protein [Thermoleophilaceae bacterium]
MPVELTTEEVALEDVLHALSDPVRLRIVAAIADAGELSCGAVDVPVTKSTCTHHFRVLREAGVITQRQVGTARLNSLNRADLDARFPGLLDTILRAAVADRA